MLETLLGAALFSALILILVLAILAARAWLIGTGAVDVVFEGGRRIRAPVGSTLLDALTGAGIRFAVIMGSDEKSRGTVMLKDLTRGVQEEVPVPELVQSVMHHLDAGLA